MAPEYLALSVGSAFFWSAFDLARKSVSPRINIFLLLGLLSLLQAPIFAFWASGSAKTPDYGEYWRFAIGCLVANTAANLLYLASVRRSTLAAAIPMLAFSPVFTSLLSLAFLGESLRPLQWVGIAIVVAGGLFVNGLPSFEGSRLGPTLMLGAAACWGAVSLFDKLSLRHAPVPEHVAIQSVALGIVGIALAYLLRDPSKKTKREAEASPTEDVARNLFAWKRESGKIALGAVVCAAAIGIQLVVIQKVNLGLFDAIKRSGNLIFSLAIGRVFLKEKASRRKLAGVAVLVVGIFLVLL